MKRLFDIVFSLISLVLFFPLILLLTLLIVRKLGSPAFFTQVRPGKNGKPFKMYKFRTMTQAKDSQGNLLPDAERMTAFGNFLRKSSLDELPEIFNVLRGEMSFVGPRPLLMEYLPLYSTTQMRRHEVLPGITGLAQVSGRNAISWEDRLALDVYYVDNRTFLLDTKILFLTIYKVLRKEGVTQAGHVTMSKFEGSQRKGNKT